MNEHNFDPMNPGDQESILSKAASGELSPWMRIQASLRQLFTREGRRDARMMERLTLEEQLTKKTNDITRTMP